MKKIKHFVKTFCGEVILVGGIGLFFYNIFNFSYNAEMVGGLNLNLRSVPANGIAYYYTGETLTMIALGAILITTGVLILRNKKHE